MNGPSLSLVIAADAKCFFLIVTGTKRSGEICFSDGTEQQISPMRLRFAQTSVEMMKRASALRFYSRLDDGSLVA